MADLPLDVCKYLTGIGLVPAPIEVLRRHAKLDDEVTGEVLGLDLAPLFLPEPEKGSFVIAHDDPGVRAADEISAFSRFSRSRGIA
jgi:hypothetical protein